MVLSGSKLVCSYPLVDSHQHLMVNVVSVVDATEILHEVLKLHTFVSLQEIRVELYVWFTC